MAAIMRSRGVHLVMEALAESPKSRQALHDLGIASPHRIDNIVCELVEAGYARRINAVELSDQGRAALANIGKAKQKPDKRRRRSGLVAGPYSNKTRFKDVDPEALSDLVKGLAGWRVG